MNPNMAQIDLMGLQSKVADITWLDAVVNFTNNNVPPEVITRLKELWEVTKVIGKQVYAIGKIIVMQLIDFMLQNSGMAIGAVLGAALGSLVNIIPAIGPILAPVAIAIGTFMGTVAGHRLDKLAKGELASYSDTDIFADLITIAKEFWKHFVEIFRTLKDHFEEGIYG